MMPPEGGNRRRSASRRRSNFCDKNGRNWMHSNMISTVRLAKILPNL